MKQLSIEEKARNYDEAYKKVAVRFGSNVADEIFLNKIQVGDKVTRNKDGVLVNLSQLNRVAKPAENKGKNNMGISEATKKRLEDNLNKALEKETPESCNEFLEKQGEQDNNEDEAILHRFSFYSYKDEPNILYLAGLYVNDEYRNKGIGTKILEVADKVAKSLNCHAIRLKTKKGGNAERLYRTHGYSSLATEGSDEIWLKKQCEQKPFGQRKECEDCQFNYAGECKGYCALKRNEQKPADKVEPKFKVGDWVIIDNETLHITNVTEDVYSTEEGGYIPFRYEKEARLWTIQDAKDGDVLVYDNGCVEIILLFKKWMDEVGKGAYSYIHIISSSHHVHINDWSDCGLTAHPATKEQSVLLFQKMKEAGYEWDAENKKLKKIEQKPVEPQQDMLSQEQYAKAVDECIYSEKPVEENKGNNGGISPNSEWSEKGERMIDTIIYDLERHGGKENSCYSAEINWLKSLKERYTWKPSDEQMEILQYLCETSSHPNEKVIPTLKSLYQDLKKLKG